MHGKRKNTQKKHAWNMYNHGKTKDNQPCLAKEKQRGKHMHETCMTKENSKKIFDWVETSEGLFCKMTYFYIYRNA